MLVSANSGLKSQFRTCAGVRIVGKIEIHAVDKGHGERGG